MVLRSKLRIIEQLLIVHIRRYNAATCGEIKATDEPTEPRHATDKAFSFVIHSLSIVILFALHASVWRFSHVFLFLALFSLRSWAAFIALSLFSAFRHAVL